MIPKQRTFFAAFARNCPESMEPLATKLADQIPPFSELEPDVREMVPLKGIWSKPGPIPQTAGSLLMGGQLAGDTFRIAKSIKVFFQIQAHTVAEPGPKIRGATRRPRPGRAPLPAGLRVPSCPSLRCIPGSGEVLPAFGLRLKYDYTPKVL